MERVQPLLKPTLIDWGHTTADDPTVYRDNTEVEEWQEKDPIDRFKKYLIAQGLWNDEKDEALRKEYEDEVRSTLKKLKIRTGSTGGCFQLHL